MILDDDISFEGYCKKKDEWFADSDRFLGDPPIEAQYALDLIFKTLIDDKEQLECLSTMSENTEQTNCIMLEVILKKYSRKYRKFLKKRSKIHVRFIGDPTIEAQYALDLIFKTLIDDKEQLPYLTTMLENTEQTNCIMLETILKKYSRKYRKFLKKRSKNHVSC